jgi:hypothetical protein
MGGQRFFEIILSLKKLGACSERITVYLAEFFFGRKKVAEKIETWIFF